jgi:hypothetical protein
MGGFSLIFLLSLLSINIQAVENEKFLLQWDNGEEQDFVNWRWNVDIGYGVGAWILQDDPILGSGSNYLNGEQPRSMNKTDYGFDNEASIDKSIFAPTSKEGGGSLHIRSLDIPGSDKRSTWWVWNDGKPLSALGITNANTDRMSFYLKLHNTPTLPESGTLPTSTFDIGTYLCWDGAGLVSNPGSGTGKGCPYEGPGNQHYYHWIVTNPGAWVHVLLDQNPEHLRGVNQHAGNNPSLITDNKSYFMHLHQFYMQQAEVPTEFTEFWVDEVSFYSTIDDHEPLQNDLSVNSIWVGYWAQTDHWELGFHDQSTQSSKSIKTYEARWSDKPITNGNWESAALIIPLTNGGIEVTGSEFLFRRPNGTKKAAWIKFKVPDSHEAQGNKLHFAVKDVSILGEHQGLVYPFKLGDEEASSSEHVKTINYVIGASNFIKPAAPQGLEIN